MSHGPAKSGGMDTSHRTGNTYNTANAALHSTGDRDATAYCTPYVNIKGMRRHRHGSPHPAASRRRDAGLLPSHGCDATTAPQHPPPSPCPYSQRRGSAGRLSLGSQIFWMRLCVSSMGMVKTKVFLRCSAATLGRLHGVGREKKK